jgi:hypothetical protein
MYLAENAPTGCVSGLHADIAFERGSGWTGERGRLLNALRDAGFVRAAPAREGGGMEIEDIDWAREQGAHVAKFQRDAKKPDGRSHKVVNPSRECGGSSAAPVELPRGESREKRVEIEVTASQEPRGSDGGFALTSPASKKQRAPSAQERLFDALQTTRKQRCEETGEPFVPEEWPHARRNRDLKPVVEAEEGARLRFEAAWGIYLADDGQRARTPAWSLAFFMTSGVRAKYETLAAREEAA